MQAENCTWMLWSIDNCQKRVSADRYHLAVSRAQVSTHRGRVFLKLSADKLLVFKWSQAQVCFFKFYMKYVVFMSLWPSTGADWTYLGPENSASYLKIQAGKTFSYHGHALVTLYVQFLCSDWSNLTGEFMRKIYAASWNLFTIFDSWSWHSFVSTCTVMFFNVFFHWMNKMKYSCYQESSVIHGWFVYWVFGWEMRRLSKSEIRFWMASFSFFTLLDT